MSNLQLKKVFNKWNQKNLFNHFNYCFIYLAVLRNVNSVASVTKCRFFSNIMQRNSNTFMYMVWSHVGNVLSVCCCEHRYFDWWKWHLIHRPPEAPCSGLVAPETSTNIATGTMYIQYFAKNPRWSFTSPWSRASRSRSIFWMKLAVSGL